MLSRLTSTNWSGLLRHAVDETLLASKGSKSGHQTKTIPNLCSSNPVVWSWYMDFTGRRHTQITILPYVMPTPDTGSELAEPCEERRHCRQDRRSAKHCRIISKRRQTLFGHVVRLDATTPAHQALCQVIAMKGEQSLGMNWRRSPERPRQTWIQQIGNGTPASWNRCGRVQMNVDIVGSRRNGPQLSTRHDDDDDD